MSSSVPVGLLIGWMLLLTVKHVIADFLLQNAWMAMARTRRTAGRCRCWCIAGHLAVALAMILIVAPRFWFVAFIDFAIHITVDRAKGLCVSSFNVTMEHHRGFGR